jgi:hypothetical protein
MSTRRQEQDAKAIKGAGRLGQWVLWLGSALLGALVVGALLLVLGLFAQKAAHLEDCREIELVKTGLRETLEESDRFASTSRVRTPREKLEMAVFYRDALGRLKPRHC